MARVITFAETAAGFHAEDNDGQLVFVATGQKDSDGMFEGFSLLHDDTVLKNGQFDPANYRIEVARLMGF